MPEQPHRIKKENINIEDLLKKVTPFHILDNDTLAVIKEGAEIRYFDKGTYVFRQGDPSLHLLFIVVAGTAEVTVLNEHDRETVIGYREKYDLFGETVFLSDEPYPGSVRAASDLTCLTIPHEIFEKNLSHIPEFSSLFSRILADRMRSLYQALMTDTPSKQQVVEHPLRKRVTDLMSSPVATCRTEDKITDIAAKMAADKVSSLVVTSEYNMPLGFITEKDLVSKVLAKGSDSNTVTAADVMNTNLVTVEPEAFYYEALLTMVRHNVKHLLVTSTEGLMGIVSIRDLIISRSTGALSIVTSLEAQDTIAGLAKASKEIDRVLQALIAEKASSREALEIITEFFDRLTRRVIQVCEMQMLEEGYGPPPVAYSWINMGSSGRKEQFTKTDQDNGIIYDKVPAGRESEVARYFQILAEKIVEGLYQAGFEKCLGNVMASNPHWCRPLSNWRRAVNNWVDNLESDNVRSLSIFLDFRHIYGEKSLADKLRAFVANKFQKSPSALLFLAKDDLNNQVPLNFFKQIVTEKTKEHRNHINLKSSACVHVVDCLRIFALREGIEETNTFERLELLTAKKVFSADDAELISVAYESLMMLRIKRSLSLLGQGEKPDNYVDLGTLSKREKAMLREAFIAVDRLQNLTGHAFYAFIS